MAHRATSGEPAGIEVRPGNVLFRVHQCVEVGAVDRVAPIAELGDPVRPEAQSGIADLEIRNRGLHVGPDRLHVHPPARDVFQGQEEDVEYLGAGEALGRRVDERGKARHRPFDPHPISLQDLDRDVAQLPVVDPRQRLHPDSARPEPLIVGANVSGVRVVRWNQDTVAFRHAERGVGSGTIVESHQIELPGATGAFGECMKLGEDALRRGVGKQHVPARQDRGVAHRQMSEKDR